MAASLTMGAAPAGTLPLWPDQPPGGTVPLGLENHDDKGAISNIAMPRVTIFRAPRPNGMAALVMAGGGYARIEAGLESTPACQWLQANGISAFELIYRLPEDGWAAAAPFQDAQRAMRLIRARAAGFHIDPTRIGVIGFSAGGHLAGMTGVRPDEVWRDRLDDIDDIPARPNFMGLIYPVLTMMPPYDTTRSKREILGVNPTLSESEAWSIERHVNQRTPPVFLAQAADDPISPIANSLLMFQAARAAGISAELHVFQTGQHGWGMGRPGTETLAWPGLFMAWARASGFLPEPA